MKNLLLISTAAILLLTIPAGAEDAPQNQPPAAAQPVEAPSAPPALPTPPASPAPSPSLGKFYLEIEQSDLQAIAAGINELPKKIADPLILKLNGQLNPQVQAQIKAQQESATKAITEKVPLPKRRPGKRD